MSSGGDKKTMLTAKYDMKMLKQIVEIDEKMKLELCKLEGVEDEDSLPEVRDISSWSRTTPQVIQNLDLQDYLGFSQDDATRALYSIFSNSLSSKKPQLETLASNVSKR